MGRNSQRYENSMMSGVLSNESCDDCQEGKGEYEIALTIVVGGQVTVIKNAAVGRSRMGWRKELELWKGLEHGATLLVWSTPSTTGPGK